MHASYEQLNSTKDFIKRKVIFSLPFSNIYFCCQGSLPVFPEKFYA